MKYMVAVPCMDNMPTDFVMSLFTMIGASAAAGIGEIDLHVVRGSLIYDARNKLADEAIEGGFDRVLWLDSDMKFTPDLMARLARWLDVGLDFVSGLYISRKMPFEPVIYKELKLEHSENHFTAAADKFLKYPQNCLFEIDGSGFGGVMMTADLLKQVKENYGLPFYPYAGFGEDLSFCWHLKELKIPMYCDSSIKMKHIGLFEIDEQMYLRMNPQAEENK